MPYAEEWNFFVLQNFDAATDPRKKSRPGDNPGRDDFV
jgi:hypothetical protein